MARILKMHLAKIIFIRRLGRHSNFGKRQLQSTYGTFEEFSVTSVEEVAPTPGEVFRQERVIGVEINSPDLVEQSVNTIGSKFADKNFRTASMPPSYNWPDGSTIILSAETDLCVNCE